MRWTKILLINFVLTFSLIGMLLLTPPIVYSVYKLLKPEIKNKPLNWRSKSKIYTDFEWSDKYWAEFGELSTTYYDYITLRRNDYSGDTINIVDGLRVTSSPNITNTKKSKYFFFGGSTTWGTGVNDENTYPSLFAKLTKNDTKNFGETSYVSRQSLAYLINYAISKSLSDMTDVHVVFYDGVNDVAKGCRREINGLGTSHENRIRDRLENTKGKGEFSFVTTFAQLKNFLNKVFSNASSNKVKSSIKKRYYNCTSQPQKALEVAQNLVNTWEVASDFVETRGGKFTAILQPVVHYGNADTSYLKDMRSNDPAIGAQFKTVYPLIIELATASNLNFLDLTGVYDGCGECYIDFSHVGPQGHQILVSSLSQFFE